MPLMKYSLRSLMIVVTLACVYFGMYSAMLHPEVIVEESVLGIVGSGYREPHFRIGDAVAQIVFAPLVCIDRRVRPMYWNTFSDFDP
jgi:hypothetical protein